MPRLPLQPEQLYVGMASISGSQWWCRAFDIMLGFIHLFCYEAISGLLGFIYLFCYVVTFWIELFSETDWTGSACQYCGAWLTFFFQLACSGQVQQDQDIGNFRSEQLCCP